MAPNPTVTEMNLPDQSGKVFIVTGATSGVGKELAQILYVHNAKVYCAARSAEKAKSMIQTVKTKYPASKGEITHLHLDLNDLSTIKSSAEEFLSKEKKLDVLWNNAGVMIPPQGSETRQKYELQLGTNNLAPFLFTNLLTPIMVATARSAAPGSVRVVWVSSSAAGRFSPPDGVDMGNLDYKNDKSAWQKYGLSKAGNILHSNEFAKRYRKDGVVSVSLDPGNLKTDLYKNMPGWQLFVANFVLKPPIYGAYTELFAGLSSTITLKESGSFIEPWGRLSKAREDIEKSALSKADGGSGVGEQFWVWSEKQVQPYL